MAFYDEAVQENESGLQLTAGIAGAIGKWTYTMAGLGMLKKAPRFGYHVPWTRGGITFAGGKTALTPGGMLAVGGRRLGIWESRGISFGGAVKGRAMRRLYEQSTVLGMTGGGAFKAVAKTYGKRAAVGTASKYMISRAAGFAMGPLLWGMLAWDAAMGVGALYQGVTQAVSRKKGLELGGYFADSRGAYTSRQRAVQAITASQMQARSAIGNEAMLFHR